MLSPTPHNQRDDILEVSILDTINIPNRKDGSPRQPFFSALIPATEQRWQQQQTSATPSSPQTFFFSVADRQEHAVKISLWDRKEDGTTDEHQKLLGECTLPLFYVGWQWVDAKLKVKAADGAQPSKYAASYLRTRMRFTRDSRNGGRSGEIPTTEEWEPRKEEAGTPKSTADRKKFWRHTRDLGKRSPTIDRKHNEFLMSQDIRAVGGPEYAENMDKTSVRQEMLLSQPVRTISINASDSSSDDSDSDSPPPAKHGNGIGRRLSRDITKLRQLLTSTDTSHTTQQPLTQARSLSPKGSGAGGKKFWTTGRQSQVSLEVSKSVDVIPSVQSIDWSNGGGAQARTVSDSDMVSLSPRKTKTKTKSEKKKEKKEKKNKEKEEKEKEKERAKEKENGEGVVKRVKAVKKQQHHKDKSASGSFVKSKLGKKLKKKHDHEDNDNDNDNSDNSKEEEGWERDISSSEDAAEQQRHHKHSDDDEDDKKKKKKHQHQHKHKHKRDKGRGAEGLESGVVVVVTEAEEESEKTKSVGTSSSSSGSGDEAVTASSSSGEAPPLEEKLQPLKLAKKAKRKSKSGSSASAVHTPTTDKPAADKKTKSPTKPKKSP